MPLLTCEDLRGPELVVEQDPAILTLPEVLYFPIEESGLNWGIFDHGGRLVSPCAYFTGPDQAVDTRRFLAPIRYTEVEGRAPDDVYIYGGSVFHHYGHFLLSTFCRYWAFESLGMESLKIVYHGREDSTVLFARPFIAELFGAMGLGPDNFVRFDKPTRIARLIVPCPSFEETGFAHRAFLRLGHRLGEKLTRNLAAAPSDRPVYLSKARLPSGIGHLVNEAEFSDILSQHGIDVVYPEQLSLAEQIALFQNRPLVAALTGSALHTSVFAPGRTIVGMSYVDTLYSSYTMIDRMNGTRSHYVYPSNDIELLPRGPTFHLDYRLTDVNKTAGQFLRLLERAAGPDGDRPNIALGKPSRQSSFGPQEALHRPQGHSSTATSGILTGRYQFHTDFEVQPWWEVDLGTAHRIRRVVLHNRSDNSQDRATRFVIEGSVDGGIWRMLHRQDQPVLFGNGLEDSPFVWEAEGRIEARLIRITLLETTFFHLDQIEVFGDTQGLRWSPLVSQHAD